MRGNLCCARTVSANLLQVFFDLLTTRTRCVQILLRIALDLRLAVLAAFDLVAQLCSLMASSERYTLVTYCCDWKRLRS